MNELANAKGGGGIYLSIYILVMERDMCLKRVG